jgi:primosomal protein N' (replication factor Y)
MEHSAPAPTAGTGKPYAEIVVNVEVALSGTFHYHVPADLRSVVGVGQLVEVEFGRRLAQGIIVSFSDSSPVEETKPIISVIDPHPVVQSWQIDLARWMSARYLAPLNACLRQMLPPGLTRWADATYDLNPYWDGAGKLTETQAALVKLLRARGDLRGRQISRALPKTEWQRAAGQLVDRGVLRRASVLDAPRARPKVIRTAELSAGWKRISAAADRLGRSNREAAVLLALAAADDPLPAEPDVVEATRATEVHLRALVERGWITRQPGQTLVVPAGGRRRTRVPERLAGSYARLPAEWSALPDPAAADELLSLGLARLESSPPTLSLRLNTREALREALALKGAERFDLALAHLAREARPVPVEELTRDDGVTLRDLRRLEELDLIRFGSEEVWRDPLADRDFAPAEPPELTFDQARVWGRIKVAMMASLDADEEAEEDLDDDEQEWDRGGEAGDGDRDATDEGDRVAPFLLHGVTGSGKTEIYMRAIDFALQRGKRAIVLVPEIALTPQTVRRFAARFPGRVAVLHSRLKDGERYDTWRRARSGRFDIVIGPRSALFSPLPNLGVIVVDEEHDPSYKQSPPVPAPYYHARDVAIALGGLTGAEVILGSATPDVVTYHRARGGRYQLLELPRRIMGHRQRITSQESRLNITGRYRPLTVDDLAGLDDAFTIPMPPVQVVDMRQELRAGNRSIFSRPLEAAIDETLARKEQVILFLNRRGTATFVMCRDCGYVANCPRCDVPLTYHQPHLHLTCHQCGRREPNPSHCPRCGSDRIRYFGLGTEKVQEEVARRWPAARLTRWDRDTTAGADSHEQLLASFIERESDILIGTQMIAKGLDLPFVTLVGVISADVALGLPDFRSNERTFQLLAQVAGRAGRGLLGGRVVVQTYQPEHYAIQAAADHDFAAFYIQEIGFRTTIGLPPFRRMARLVYADPISDRAEAAARGIANLLLARIRDDALDNTELIGPTPPFFARLDGRYRWQIIIRSPDPNRVLQDVPLPPPWVVDVDPVSIL